MSYRTGPALAQGRRDEWLRVTHTLISLGRLADRNLISEQERSELSEAYRFCERSSTGCRWSMAYKLIPSHRQKNRAR